MGVTSITEGDAFVHQPYGERNKSMRDTEEEGKDGGNIGFFGNLSHNKKNGSEEEKDQNEEKEKIEASTGISLEAAAPSLNVSLGGNGGGGGKKKRNKKKKKNSLGG